MQKLRREIPGPLVVQKDACPFRRRLLVAGDVIEAVGLPVPDLSQINLTHVKWTKRGTEPLHPSPVIDLNADEMSRFQSRNFATFSS